jgi:hypothetical protein
MSEQQSRFAWVPPLLLTANSVLDLIATDVTLID